MNFSIFFSKCYSATFDKIEYQKLQSQNSNPQRGNLKNLRHLWIILYKTLDCSQFGNKFYKLRLKLTESFIHRDRQEIVQTLEGDMKGEFGFIPPKPWITDCYWLRSTPKTTFAPNTFLDEVTPYFWVSICRFIPNILLPFA